MDDEHSTHEDFLLALVNRLSQAVHELRQRAEPAHDTCSCWCCCLDCDFEGDGDSPPSWTTWQ